MLQSLWCHKVCDESLDSVKQPFSLRVRLFRKPSQFNLCLCLPREFIDGLHWPLQWLHKQKLYSYLCSWQLASHCTPITWIGLTFSELSTRRQSCLMIFSFHTMLSFQQLSFVQRTYLRTTIFLDATRKISKNIYKTILLISYAYISVSTPTLHAHTFEISAVSAYLGKPEVKRYTASWHTLQLQIF